LAFLYANLVEWIWHKYVFHGVGKKKGSKFSSHWRLHHRDVRKSGGFDLSYQAFTGIKDDPMREVFELTLGALLHTPLFFIFPYFAATVWIHAIAYFLIHRKSHLDIVWAKKWAPWHYDHHMGKNQDANWCVTLPVWDHILGTRLYFLKHQEYNNQD
jgi:sterol desaturase/sphingolipid hydroxylase (fatty acid hydroxylase superfamily)